MTTPRDPRALYGLSLPSVHSGFLIPTTSPVVSPPPTPPQPLIAWNDSLVPMLSQPSHTLPLASTLSPVTSSSLVPFIVRVCTDYLRHSDGRSLGDNPEAEALRQHQHPLLCIEGIFRMSGDQNHVQDLRSKFDSLYQDSQFLQKLHALRNHALTLQPWFPPSKAILALLPFSLDDYSPHAIAGVLKLFFRMMPQPLFPFDLYERIVSIGRVQGSDSLRFHSRFTPHAGLKFSASFFCSR